jgi:CubicO group peptidase (beta-lactamase class C family)
MSSYYTLVLSLLLPLLVSFLYLNWTFLSGFLYIPRNMGQSKSTPTKFCPPPGPSLPAPTQATIDNLRFDYFPDGSAFLPLVQNEPWYSSTTFSVQASIDGATVFKHASYRTGAGITVPSGDVSGLLEKQTRLGSVSKAFTVLALLLSKDLIHWDDPITKYGPKLDKVYENVTVGALAGQTSGLGRYVCFTISSIQTYEDTS